MWDLPKTPSKIRPQGARNHILFGFYFISLLHSRQRKNKLLVPVYVDVGSHRAIFNTGFRERLRVRVSSILLIARSRHGQKYVSDGVIFPFCEKHLA